MLDSPGLSGELAALAQARLTMAATIAWALTELPAANQAELATSRHGRDGRLLLWIVGARESMEGELARNGHFAEPLARLLPPALSAGGLELVLIGPEMKGWELELSPHGTAAAAADGAAASLVVRAVSGTLHAATPDVQEKGHPS